MPLWTSDSRGSKVKGMAKMSPMATGWRVLGAPCWPVGKRDLYRGLGRKQRALLAYLLVSDSGATRAELAALLWPDADGARARHSLRQAIVTLKKALGTEHSDRLHIEDESLAFDTEGLDLDLSRLREIVVGAPASPEEILEVCRGPLLPDLTSGSAAFDALSATWRDAFSKQMASVLEDGIEGARLKGRLAVVEALEHRWAQITGRPAPAVDRNSGSPRPFRVGSVLWYFGGGFALGAALFVAAFALSPDLRRFLRTTLVLPEAASASIAVKPFNSVNGLPEEKNLAGGVTVGVTYALYAITARELFVVTVPPDSMATADLDALSYARMLGVRYLITGQLEQDGSVVRVFARCLDTESGVDVWQDRFDSTTAEAFHLQDEITLRILQGLDINLSSAERNRLQFLDDTEELNAWLLAANGVRSLIKIDPENLDEAFDSYSRALRIDPDYTSARRGLAWHALLEVRFGVAEDPLRNIQEARNQLNVILRKRPDDGMSKALEGLMLLLENDWDAAVKAGLAATRLLPGSADVWAVLAHSYTFAGQPEQALDAIDRAMALSPGHPPFYDWIKARALRLKGDHAAAIELLDNNLDATNRTLVQLVELAAAYSAAGRIGDARVIADRIRRLHPDFSASDWVQHPAAKDPGQQSHEFELLSKAGL